MPGRLRGIGLLPLACGLVFFGLLFSMLAVDCSGVRDQEKVNRQTFVVIERQFLCGDRELLWEGEAPPDLVGLGRRELAERFSSEAGWRIEASFPARLRLTQRVTALCAAHQSYRHLGLKNGYMAIFEGPLGFNQRVLRYERKLPEGALTPALRTKLRRAMDFEKQPARVKRQLQQDLEFSSEANLNAALENLDELQE